MASYAALLSAMHTLNQIKKHPRPPISLDPKQVESLTQNITFLLNFLERCSGDEEDDDLESRIAAAAYATEDVIDSNIFRRSKVGTIFLSPDMESMSFFDFKDFKDLYKGLEKAIQDMDLIKKEVAIKDEMGGREDRRPLKRRPASTRQSSTVFEFDDVLINKILDKLIAQESFQVIPIVGMGGIGKTSLARNIYTNSVTIHHFDILVWVTISQEFSLSEILSQVLSQGNNGSDLGERVHQKLWGRRYLIVMDDLWGIEAWNQVKSFFPNNNNGSRVMITTRLSTLAFDISGSRDFKMKFLDKDKSWTLFCKTVFDKEGCPIELEYIAKNIVRNCRGLPLSIIVIGGLLTNSNITRTYWEYILENLSSLINLEDDEYCLRLLRMSYKELPIHLQPCFLYMGIFREDYEIRVSEVIKLWVAEGILRPNEGKRLEEVAEECIMELVDRNLISVYKLNWKGEVKFCKVHDLLRDLCLREGKKQRFLCVIKDQQVPNVPECMNMERRICIDDNMKRDYSSQLFHSLEPALLIRSFILQRGWPDNFSSLSYRLLRVLTSSYAKFWPDHLGAIFQNINLRYLTLHLSLQPIYIFPSSWILLWNLQTIKIYDSLTFQLVTAPSEFWEMVLLRHVMITNLQLPDPSCVENGIHLEDLHTLSCVTNFKCSNAVIKRIQNIRILKIWYTISLGETEYHRFYVNNFYHLKNLQSLNLRLSIHENIAEEFGRYMGQNLNFPNSLKKLTLRGNVFKWEECRTKIGLLPFLEYLKLDCNWYANWTEWETVAGQFCNLKFLHLVLCLGLRYWKTDNTHFPRLEHLVLQSLVRLKEIPSSIGDIPTLKSIQLDGCSKSAADSARRIKEEQIELGNEDLQLIIDSDEECSGEDEDDMEEEDEEDKL